MNDEAVGFFDSGVGGLSVWREFIGLMPNENTCYLADSAHIPYGTKSRRAIRSRCEKLVEQLLKRSVKLIVVACNTATAAAIGPLRAHHPLPFVGLEPAVKPAALQTKRSKIAVLATQGTLQSEGFEATAERYRHEVEVFVQEGKGLVEQVEKNALDDPQTEALLQSQLKAIRARNIDCLVLGCTHYPFLKASMEKILGPEVQILDTGKAVARQIQQILIQRQNRNPQPTTGEHTLFTNGDPNRLKAFVQHFAPPKTRVQYEAF